MLNTVGYFVEFSDDKLLRPGFITDAIWFRSVNFESVFWTRVGTQAGLFGGTFVVSLLVLLGGLFVADRSVPRGSGTAARAGGGRRRPRPGPVQRRSFG